jgi:predicted CoA-substrate-specific enzyme activase
LIFAGIDIGSLTAKALILKEDQILSWSILSTSEDSVKIAKTVMNEALKKADLSLSNIERVVSTGIGKEHVPFAKNNYTEIQCAVKGARWFFPSARTIIDIGAEGCRTITCDEKGRIMNFEINDKCAAGTGIFLDTIAKMLEVTVEDMGRLSMESKNTINVSSTCVVFAESEVISLIHKKINKADILSAIYRSIASRVQCMLSKIDLEGYVVMTGGVAKNCGFNRELGKLIGTEVLVPEKPQIVGALGAALLARENI